MGDRGCCSFAHLGLLVQRGVHAVFRMHQQIIVELNSKRSHCPRRCEEAAGRPTSFALGTAHWA